MNYSNHQSSIFKKFHNLEKILHHLKSNLFAQIVPNAQLKWFHQRYQVCLMMKINTDLALTLSLTIERAIYFYSLL